MKKIVLVVVLIAFLGAGTAFAHPSGLGIGIFGQYGFGDIGGTGGGLSLKISGVPVFWGISAGIGSDYFGFGVNGDFYIIDNKIGGIDLEWYFGLGGFFRMDLYDRRYWLVQSAKFQNISTSYMYAGARIPIGLSFQFQMFDIFLQAVPSLGVSIYSGYEHVEGAWTYKDEGKIGFGWGVPIELGIRIWL